MTATQFSWLPRLERACLEATVVPMAGGLPSVPTAAVEKFLCDVLRISDLTLTFEPPTFLDAKEGADLAYQIEQEGARLLSLHVKAPPLQGTASLLIDQSTLWSLLHASLGKPVEGLVPLVDEDINHGFGTFALCAALQALSQASYPPQTRLEIVEHPESTPALVIQASLAHAHERWPFRVIISESLLKSAQRTMSPRPIETINPALAAIIDLSVDLPVGRVELPWKQIKKLHPGDVLVLDQLDLDLASGDGSVLLRVGTQDVWSCRLTNGQLIAEQPFPAHAEDRAMSFTPDSDDELFGDLDEIGSFADFELDNIENDTPSKKKQKKAAEDSSDRSDEKVPAKLQKGGIAEKVNVQLTVSLGRLSLTARELFELKAGNVLNFPIQTSGQVDLLVGADLVGRGELVQIGDALGVRIVEL